MKFSKLLFASAFSFLLMTGQGLAQDAAAAAAPAADAAAAPAAEAPKAAEGTLEEAKALALKAAAYVKEVGKEKAIEEFNKPESQFIDRDLYVFVNDNAGVFLAHPKKPALVGQNMMDMKDVNGVELVKKFVEVQTEGWVDYVWPHPTKKTQLPKSSYIVRVDDIVVGVGAYKNQ